MSKLSILISTFSGKDTQLDMSLASLVRDKFNPSKVELLVFIDYPNNESTQKIIKKYSKYFSSLRIFSVNKKISRINHSVTRRNFLASKAKGEYIVFSEPEMFHINNTINNVLDYLSKNKNKKEWLCGPVYAAGDLVDKTGKVTDNCIQRPDPKKYFPILKLKNLINQEKFKKNYFLVDYDYYHNPFFFVIFNRATFNKLKGLNQNLKVRGFEELEFFNRFSKMGGQIVILNKIPSVHIPHKRNLNKELQISWNLYNSTVNFDKDQKFGEISDTLFEEILIK